MLREDYSVWQCGSHEISLARPRVMGILNVTPDSFSDGGEHADADAAIEYGMEMLDQGADIIDVGGESTRPGFEPVSPEEEAARIVPVVRALVEEGAVVSVDTRHPEVAELCVRLGASIVNDVTGFTDQRMIDLAAASDVGCVIMHAGGLGSSGMRREVMLDSSAAARARAQRAAGAVAAGATAVSASAGTTAAGQAEGPAAEGDAAEGNAAEGEAADGKAADAAPERDALADVMRRSARGVTNPTVRLSSGAGARRTTLPDEAPIMRQVMGFLGDRARLLMRAGVDQRRICVDPGAGFGKLANEDIVIQRATAKMVSMGYPVMCALSRKRVVGAVSGAALADRDAATIGMALAAAEQGARVLRVHDVAGMVRALDGYWAASHRYPRRAFVALGSNVGDRLGYLARAVRLIDAIPLTTVVGVSDAYESEPAYGIATPVANCIVEIRSELDPLVLLDDLLGVEDELGRIREPGMEGHGPRTIDCDLAWMEGESHAGRRLCLPHRGLGERDFVLVPMADLQHDPVRFLSHEGVEVAPEDQRVGRVISDLGEVRWQ